MVEMTVYQKFLSPINRRKSIRAIAVAINNEYRNDPVTSCSEANATINNNMKNRNAKKV